MRIRYVAYDSFGVKSMCTQIKTRDTTITIDPGVAVESKSFPLPEKKRERLARRYHKKIGGSCRRSEYIIITHYHYDHHLLDIDFYRGKRLIVKDPKRNINKSQNKRALKLIEYVGGETEGIAYGDGRTFSLGGGTEVSLSRPLWHGAEKTRLGFVYMVEVKDGDERFLYTSDLCGMYMREQADSIIERNPDVLVLDGFPSYLLGYLASYRNLRNALKNTIYVLENTECRKYIIDHHLLRDYRYRQLYYEVYRRADELGKNVLTAAEDQGEKPAVLEAYEKYGPTRWRSWGDLTFEKLDALIKKRR